MRKSFCFEVLHTHGKARLGRLNTPHGEAQTPMFMAVGTRGTVKGILPQALREARTQCILGNTYHLALRPGAERIAELGGLHAFMGWAGPILTDSGGYQVFSLQDLRTIGDDGVRFRSHIDGRWLELTPESAIDIQEKLGADIIMCFDECPPARGNREQIERAVERTSRWARRCQEAHAREDQALFGIVQGGLELDLRRQSAVELVALDFPGYALGGLSVGETQAEMLAVLDGCVEFLPEDKPRYLMGVGTPTDLLEAIARGVDMFDCVLPTRNGRNAQAFTRKGKLRLRNARFARDPAPLDEDCDCPACRDHSRAYLHHLFSVEEMLGPILVSLHNLTFYNDLMQGARSAIAEDRFDTYRATAIAAFAESP